MIAVRPSLPEDLERVASKLRHTALGRLRASLPGVFATRVAAGRALAHALANAAQGIEDAEAAAMPEWRELPWLEDQAVGDQVRLLAYDLLAVLPAAPDLVWMPATPGARVPVDRLIVELTALLAAVDRVL